MNDVNPGESSGSLVTAAAVPLTAQEQQRLRFILGTMVVALVASVVAAVLAVGPISAFIITPLLGLALVVYAVKTKDAVLGHLLVFGLVAGLAELPSDWFGVVTTQTLVYPPGEPLILVSPAYMPISWMVTMAQLGTLALYAVQQWGLLKSSLGMMVLGGINMPTYETLAHHAGWWYYQNTPMLFGTTPYYVILGETLLSAALPTLVTRVSASSYGRTVLLGLAQGVWILLTGVFAWWVIDR